MTAKTTIEWTDRTWNPVRGCTRVSPGCDHCYAEGIAARFSGAGLAYEGLAKMVHGKPHWTGKIQLVEQDLLAPLGWKKPCRVFVNSMSDLFHEGVPDAYIDRVLAVIALTPHITYQVLTKRAKRMREVMGGSVTGVSPRGFACPRESHVLNVAQHMAMQDTPDSVIGKAFLRLEQAVRVDNTWRWPLPNLHLGVSPCDQATADALIPDLLATPAAVRFISAEPLLGAMDLEDMTASDGLPYNALVAWAEPKAPLEHRIDWVIVGGESGRGARPMHPDWARSLRDQCVAAGVAFFFKQWGEWGEVDSIERTGLAPMGWSEPYREDGGYPRIEVQRQDGKGVDALYRVGKKRAGRELDGRTWDELPGVGK